MNYAEFANQMSDILIGYREGSEADMLDRARELVALEQTARIGDAHRKIEDAVCNLLDTIDDARAGAFQEQESHDE